MKQLRDQTATFAGESAIRLVFEQKRGAQATRSRWRNSYRRLFHVRNLTVTFMS